jgi:hypothetical protein
MSKLNAISRALAAVLLVAAPAIHAADKDPSDRVASLEARISALEAKLERVDHDSQVALDRGAIENVFSNYMYLHNAFHDEDIKALWAKRGTLGMSAQYSNLGVYTRYESTR